MAKKPRDNNRVLLIAAHPDDPEYGCAGTVARWAADGREVTYLLLTSGDKGSKDPAMRPGALVSLREKEQAAAARRLGVKDLVFLRRPDGMLENNLDLRREIVGVIRRLRPWRVITIDPWKHYQTHPDHRAAGSAALDAVYAAKQVNLFAEQLVDGVEPWRVKEAYLFWTDNADTYVDVSGVIGKRVSSLMAHRSQVKGTRRDHETWIRKGAGEIAKKAGLAYRYAEGFKLLKF
jgi:LmbE family N-acetylglucosaminyl deacetylase